MASYDGPTPPTSKEPDSTATYHREEQNPAVHKTEFGSVEQDEKTNGNIDSHSSDACDATPPSSVPFRGPLSGWRLFVVQFCLAFGLMLSVMDTSIVATSLVTIALDFDDFIRVTWVVLAYLLTYMGFAIATAKLSDVIGRKWGEVVSLVIFGGFSIGCGAAQNMTQLIVFRALQGIGGSGLFSMIMVTSPELMPAEKVAMMSGVIGLVFALSAVLGPILGGVITTNTTWRWIFYLNVPCTALILVLLLVSWRGSGHTLAMKTKWKQLDYAGTVLLLAGSVLLVFALQEGGAAAYAWNSPVIICTLTFSGVCFVAFALWIQLLSRINGTVQPIFPSRLVTQRIMGVVLFTTTLTGFSYFLVLIQLPNRFQLVDGNSPQTAGFHLLPLLLGSALGSFLGGALSSRRNLTFYTLTAASALILLGCGLLSTISTDHDIPGKIYGYQVILGVGAGLTFSTTTIMVICNAHPADNAVAQGAVAQARIFGGSIGLAISTIIFNDRAVSDLRGILTPSEINDLRKSLSTVLYLSPAQRLAVRRVFALSFKSQLRVCTYVAAGCFIIALFAFQKQPPSVQDKKREQSEEMARQRAMAAQQQRQEC